MSDPTSRLQKLLNMETCIETIVPIARIRPEVLDYFKVDVICNLIRSERRQLTVSGFAPNWVPSPVDELEEIAASLN